jgi:hypothetical protein
MGATHEATVGVVSSVERQTGMMVGMKWAQALVACYPQSESLGNCLNGQFAELLNFVFFHNKKDPS